MSLIWNDPDKSKISIALQMLDTKSPRSATNGLPLGTIELFLVALHEQNIDGKVSLSL